MASDYVHALNWLVLVSGAVGCFITSWGGYKTLVEFISLQAYGVNGPLRVSSVCSMIQESICFTLQVVVLLVGGSLVLNNSRSTIGILAWSVGSWLIDVISLAAQWRRRRHLQYAAEEAVLAKRYGARREHDPKE